MLVALCYLLCFIFSVYKLWVSVMYFPQFWISKLVHPPFSLHLHSLISPSEISSILGYSMSILFLGLASLNWNLIMILVTLLCLPTVAAMPTQDHFPDVTFKVFSEFVIQNFSFQVSLATVLLVLFSLTENPDLLNLHSHQKSAYVQGEKKWITSGWIKSWLELWRNTWEVMLKP